MAYAVKNSLFVRNLSPEVNENLLREVFGICDEIEQITFKPYNTLANQFFAQVDFATSKGIIEGSKLSGSCILGVPCVCGVIDPLASPAGQNAEGDLSLGMDPAAIQAEFARRTKEAEDDQKFRTVHISGIGMDMTFETVRTLCKNFGEVERLRLDEDDNGGRFALCEFRERGPAHVCKMQQQYLVQGRVLHFRESQTMVDECSFAERTVQFEDPYLHAIAMRSQLTQPGQLNEKLKLVRQAAESILPSAAQPGGWGFSRDAPPPEEKEEKEKKKKEKKEGKEKKDKKEKKEKKAAGEGGEKEKKEKKEKKKEKKRLKELAKASQQGDGNPENPGNKAEKDSVNANGRRRVRYKRRRRPGEKKGDHKKSRRRSDGDASRSRSRAPEKAEMVEDESDGPIDLDEVEVVQGTELVIMGSQSSSSSSSSDDEEKPARGAPRKEPIELDMDGVVELEGEAPAPAKTKAARSRSPSSESLS